MAAARLTRPVARSTDEEKAGEEGHDMRAWMREGRVAGATDALLKPPSKLHTEEEQSKEETLLSQPPPPSSSSIHSELREWLSASSLIHSELSESVHARSATLLQSTDDPNVMPL
jgi:hypothetical protein